jgi:hypothetical protein
MGAFRQGVGSLKPWFQSTFEVQYIEANILL